MQSAQEMTDKPHIIADCDIPFLKGVLEPYADMEYLKGSEISHADALRADALIIRTRTRCDGRLLDGTPVRLIATATIGHDHIDSPYCREHRIEIRTAAGCNARGVLQYVMAALAALARRDGWTPAGRTLGVVGVGSVGSLIAQYGERFGFRVLRCDPPKAKQDPAGDYTELNEMLPQCDIVTCHVPLSVNGDYPTKAMADASFFASMKPGAVFVNTSRGGIVVDEDLIEARRSGRLSHTVIDTWNDEPHISLAGHAPHRRLYRSGQSRRNGRCGPRRQQTLLDAARRLVPAAGNARQTRPVDRMGADEQRDAPLLRHRGRNFPAQGAPRTVRDDA